MLLLSLLIACEPGRPDVVLVTLDTTRVDYLGAYGGPVPTPNLRALAQAGTRFDRAYSPTPLTQPAHASLMSGLEPQRHGVQANGQILDGELLLLGEHFKQAGWTTLASVGAFVTLPRWGLAQGFEQVDHQLPASGPNPWRRERGATAVVQGALDLLAQHREPVLLWVHLYDPHAPYVDSYEAEIQRVDAALGTLMAAMDARPGQTLWVVVGDHGEGLGQHIEMEHGLFVDEAQMRVPWVLSGPGVPVAVVDQPVSLSDVLPTLLHALELPIPAGLDGQVQPGNPHPIVLESWQLTQRFGWRPHRALIDGDYKLDVLTAPTLYQVAVDPGQRQPLTDPERLAQMLETLGEGVQPVPPADLDADTQAALASLGYLSGPSAYEATLAQPDLIALGLLEAAAAAHQAQDTGAELQALADLVSLHPELREAQARYIDALAQSGDLQAGLAHAEVALALHPWDARLLSRCAALYGQAGDHEQALALAERAGAIDSKDRMASELQVQAFLALGQPAQALDRAHRILAGDPGHDVVAGLAGLLLARQGKTAKALPLLEQSAASMDPPLGVRTRLAGAVAGGGNQAQALALLLQELEQNPGYLPALELASVLQQELGDYAGALLSLQQLRAARPNNLVYVDAQVRVLLALGESAQALEELAPYLVQRPDDARLQALERKVRADLPKGPAGG